MRMSNKAKAFFEKAKLTEEYWVSKAMMDFSFELATRASEQKINGKSLAEKIGSSAAYISKVFRGQSNLTLESMVKLARATGSNIEIKFVNQFESRQAAPVTAVSEDAVTMPTVFLGKFGNYHAPANSNAWVSKVQFDSHNFEKQAA